MEKILKIEILGHSKEINSSVGAYTKGTYLEGGQHKKTIRCLCICRATKVATIITLFLWPPLTLPIGLVSF